MPDFSTAPATWSDYFAMLDTLKTKLPSGVYPAAYSGGCPSYNLYAILYSYGGDLFTLKNGKFYPSLNSPAGVEALKTYVKLMQASSPDAVTWCFGPTRDAFNSGKAATYIEFNADEWGLAQDKSSSLVAGNVGIADPPKGTTDIISSITGWMLAGSKKLSSDQVRKSAVLDLMSWATSTDVLKRVAIQGGLLPANIAVVQQLLQQATDPDEKVLRQEQLDTLQHSKLSFPAIPTGVASWRPALDKVMQELALGQHTPEEAAALADKEMTDSLTAAGYYK